MMWIFSSLFMLLLFWAVVLWAVTRFFLAGEDLSRFDLPAAPPINDAPSEANAEVLKRVKAFAEEAGGGGSNAERLQKMREGMDAMGAQADLAGIDIIAVTVAGRPAEWLVASARENTGRLLYLHGGAFTMGSPLSHRAITTELARRTGLAVLAIDYRLMPEHARVAGIADCQAAYRWILQNGPEGSGPVDTVFVAGDSAGGNLTLSLVAWIRDEINRGAAPELRQVSGAIALSPLTDATFASPSMQRNVDDDPMLGPMARQIQRVPRAMMLWFSLVQNRMRPTDRRLSPLRGDLANLPPILIQASEAEILVDDARRYANKARAAGSPVEVETWRGMVHVWPAFGQTLPESDQAFGRMADFITRVMAARDQADAA